jgi:DNA modification methylase
MGLPKCYRCGKRPCECKDGIAIYHADCREVMPGIESGSVRLVWTDPPYGHGNQDGDLQAARVRDGVKGARKKAAVAIANDSGMEWEHLMVEFIGKLPRLLATDCCCCCCCCCGGGGPKPTFARVAQWLDTDLEFFHAVVWDKSDRGNGMGWRFRRNYEFVMVAHRRGGKLAWSDDKRAVPNILRIVPEPNVLHPTTKPLSLVRHFVEWTTQTGDLVLDPFMGSGTTLRAAKDLGRRAIGIEIEERYCEIAAKRLEQQVLFT